MSFRGSAKETHRCKHCGDSFEAEEPICCDDGYQSGKRDRAGDCRDGSTFRSG